MFSEQPSAAKWNILGTNCASFNDGTGIGAGAITTSAIANASVTPAKLTNPYQFSVYASTSPVLSAGVWTKALLDTELFDDNNNFDSVTNHRYVAPVNGRYWINGRAGISASGLSTSANAQAAIYVNGAAVRYGDITNGSGDSNEIPRISVTALLNLNATDYVELYGYCSEGSRNLVGASTVTFLEGWLVTPT